MKSYEETAKNVLCMRDNYLRKRAERRKKVISFCTPAAALCLALIIGVGFSGMSEQSTPPTILGAQLDDSQRPENEIALEGGEGEEKFFPDIYPIDSMGISSDELGRDLPPASTYEVVVGVTSGRPGIETAPPEEDVRQMDICRGLVYINRIVGEATAARRAYDKENYYSEVISAEEAEEYYGINMEKILTSLPAYMRYVPSEHTFIIKTDGTVTDDSAHFYIEGDGKGSITISCGKALPPYDCIYMLSNEKASEVMTDEGEAVSLLMGYKDNNEESGICALFFADFKLGGVYYRIECRNYKPFDNVIGPLIEAIIS